MKTRKRREHGQVIYLLAIGIISLLGFTALAIDGARLFSERRTAQGVADTAAFTAAAYLGKYRVSDILSSWKCATCIDQRAESAALERIRSNGYTDPIYDPFGGNDRLRIEIEPYPDKTNLTNPKRFLVKVFMISEVEPIFAQLIYDGPLLVNVESHAIVMPQDNLGFGDAMVSLSEDECNALQFTGGSTIDILGSGIFANSTCEPNSINLTGGTIVNIEEDVSTPGDIDNDGTSSLTSGGTDAAANQEDFQIVPPPDCASQPAGSVVKDMTTVPTTYYYFPGVHATKINIPATNLNHVFLPGLFCLKKGLSITGGTVTGDNVTFFIETGSVSASNAVMNLTAPTGGQADDGTNSWDGMLFYIKADTIDLKPLSGSNFVGTIYGPSDKINPTCKLTGNGDTVGYNLQFVCNTITLAGGAGLFIDFDGNSGYSPPVSIDLIQ